MVDPLLRMPDVEVMTFVPEQGAPGERDGGAVGLAVDGVEEGAPEVGVSAGDEVDDGTGVIDVGAAVTGVDVTGIVVGSDGVRVVGAGVMGTAVGRGVVGAAVVGITVGASVGMRVGTLVGPRDGVSVLS